MPPSASSSQSIQPLSALVLRHGICCCIVLLLAVLVPLVLRSPLTSDTVMFDLQARTVTNGGVLYRDILEPNFPGVVWCHLLIRGVGGWSPEWIRCADLLIVGTAIAVLLWVATRPMVGGSYRPTTRWRDAQVISSAGFFFATLFYLTRNEWCHCQRDSWMLLPVSAAMAVHVFRGNQSTTHYRLLWYGLLEGICWGIAFWIKPHVAVPATCVLLTGALVSRDGRRYARYCLAVIAGGLLIAIPGILWLVAHQAWQPFMTMQLDWNSEYLQAGADRRSMQKVWHMLIRFHPWWVVHVVAMPVAVMTLWNVSRTARQTPSDDSRHDSRSASLSALYLGWFAQACVLQHAMDYIQVAPVLLGIVLLTAESRRLSPLPARCGLAAFTAVAILAMPVWRANRLSQWAPAFTQPRTWQQVSALAQGRFPDWNDMGRVVAFLESHGVRTGDVTCFNTHGIHVYAALQSMPSTRYVGVATLRELFPSRTTEIDTAVRNCGARFIVTDDDEVTPDTQKFPWNLPVVFSAGSIRVHCDQNAVCLR
jgi:hypothetical protein